MPAASSALDAAPPHAPAVNHAAAATQEFRVVATESIQPSPTNPRKRFDPKSLEDLATSIKSHGVLQPILVRPIPFDDTPFEIVAGERRWRAARMAGLHEIPCRVRDLDDRAVLEIQTIENLQREDVHPLEEAAGFDGLITSYAYTPAQIAEKMAAAAEQGKSVVRVSTEYADEKTLKKLDAVRDYGLTKVTKQNRCQHVETAIVVHGPDVGKTFEVCRESKCKTHHPHGVGSRGFSRSPQEEAVNRRRNFETKLEALYLRELWTRTAKGLEGPLDRDEVDVVAAYLLDRIGHDIRAELCKSLQLEPKKTQYSTDYLRPLLAHYKKLDPNQAEGFLLALALAPALLSYGSGETRTVLRRVAESIGLDPAAIKKEISAPLTAKFKKSEESRKAKVAAERKAARTKAAAQ